MDNLRKLFAKGAEVQDQHRRDVTIVSVGNLVRIVEREHIGSYQYRGQRCGDWKLLPTLTRPDSPGKCGLDKDKGETLRHKELEILKEFRTRWVAYGGEDFADDLRLSILAQHHLAPTRLLDWSMNALAALFFAVEDSDLDLWDHEGKCPLCGLDACKPVVWAVAGARNRVPDFPHPRFDELENRPYFVIPDHAERRAAVQSSLVSLWADPYKPFDQLPGIGELWRIEIDRRKAPHILWVLHLLGINRETLFPDADGLGRYLSWKTRRIHQFKYSREGRPEPRND